MMVINKMKKILKSKKAFTLVETIGVLVIIGVLSVILIPVINNVLRNNKEVIYQSQLENIRLAAKNFGSDNKFTLPETDGESIAVTLGQLKKLGYLEESIINPKTKKEFSNCTKIEIKKINSNYEYIVDETSFDDDDCTITSSLSISGPSKKYINKESTSYYIISVNSNSDNEFAKYDIDSTNIYLEGTASTTAVYSISGENGIYKLTLKGGHEEGSLYFVLGNKTITNESGNDVIGENSIRPDEVVIVDNTPPSTPYFENDGDKKYGICYGDNIVGCPSYFSDALKVNNIECRPETYDGVQCVGTGCESTNDSFVCTCSGRNCKGDQSCAILKLYPCGDGGPTSVDNYSDVKLVYENDQSMYTGCSLRRNGNNDNFLPTEYGSVVRAVDEAGNISDKLTYSYLHLNVWTWTYCTNEKKNYKDRTISYEDKISHIIRDCTFEGGNTIYNPLSYYKIINGRWVYNNSNGIDENNGLPLLHFQYENGLVNNVNDFYCPKLNTASNERQSYIDYFGSNVNYWYNGT